MLVDTHCHLHDKQFFVEEQAEKMIVRANKAGVKKIICIGTSHKDSLAACEFSSKHNNIYWTYGIHPDSAKANLEVDVSDVPSRPIAIGEVGLDYHYGNYGRNSQIKLFEQMLQLATDYNLPLSFHVREAFPDFLDVVSNFPKVRGVVHSFSESKRALKQLLNKTGFYIGVNGLATYSTLPTPPLDRILLETDAPFLTPVPFRGIINEPAYVSNIAQWLSAKLGLEFKIIEKETTKNAKLLFGI